MSMWEVEELVERSVWLIDNSEFSMAQKRNLIWNAYEIQGYFDCSFTHFRVIDILLKYEFIQQYELQDFPLSKEYPEFFKEITQEDFKWIKQNPTKPWSAKDNPSIAYWSKESHKVFVDFGTKYYTLHPEKQPTKYDPLAFATLIIKEAGKDNKNHSIVYDWTAFMLFYLLAYFPSQKSVNVLKEDYFREVREVFQQFNYDDYEAMHEGLDLGYDVKYITENEWLSEEQKELFRYLKQ